MKFVRSFFFDRGRVFLDPGRRPAWFLFGGLALGLEIFSYVYFQEILGLRPCELCVYIRFFLLVVFLGALVVAINPGRLFWSAAGGLIIFWALVRGMVWNLKLVGIYAQAVEPGYALCSLTAPRFPFGLPLDRWLPFLFSPLALCGIDGWRFLGFNMAEWLLPIFGFLFAGFFGLFIKKFSGLVFILKKLKY